MVHALCGLLYASVGLFTCIAQLRADAVVDELLESMLTDLALEVRAPLPTQYPADDPTAARAVAAAFLEAKKFGPAADDEDVLNATTGPATRTWQVRTVALLYVSRPQNSLELFGFGGFQSAVSILQSAHGSSESLARQA